MKMMATLRNGSKYKLHFKLKRLKTNNLRWSNSYLDEMTAGSSSMTILVFEGNWETTSFLSRRIMHLKNRYMCSFFQNGCN